MPARGPLTPPRPGLVHLDGRVPLAAVPGLRAALTTRAGGASRPPFEALNLGRSVGDAPGAVAANRRAVARALGFGALRTVRQVHGARLARLKAPAGRAPPADAILLDRPGVLGAVLGADCTLALLVEPRARVLVLVHAGWRGLAQGIGTAALRALLAAPGARRARVRALIASGICGACYETGPEVVDALAPTVPGAAHAACFAVPPGGRAHVDLRAVLTAQWLAAGLDAAQVHGLGGCTREEPARWFSHRRDGSPSGRHALVAGWQAP